MGSSCLAEICLLYRVSSIPKLKIVTIKPNKHNKKTLTTRLPRRTMTVFLNYLGLIH